MNLRTITLLGAGMIVSLVVVLLAFGLPLGPTLRDLLEGSVSTVPGLARTFIKMTPLLMCSLGIVVSWKAGAYNIGGEGQFVVGALGAAALAKGVSLPGPILNPLMLMMAALLGGGYSALAGWLYVVRGVPVVISTILLNFVAGYMQDWLLTGPLQMASKKLPQTDALPVTSMLYRLHPPFDAHIGILYAVVLAGLLWVFLYFTPWGFQIRLIGANPQVARANRLSASPRLMLAMLISGACCGLAGAIEYTAITGMVGQGFAQGWGFLAIPVALLSGLHPLACVPTSLAFAALFAGSEQMSRFASGGDRLIYIVQAVAVLAYVAVRSKVKPGNAALGEESSD